MKNILFIILFSVSSTLLATTYHVATDGSGDYTTIAQVNAASFLAGDSILFRKGDIWRVEELTIDQSGTSDSYIVYGSYGSGSKPKFFGSLAASTFSLHPSLSNVYTASENIPINPYAYSGDARYRGSIFYKTNDSTTWGDGRTLYEADTLNLGINYEWAWYDSTIYFYFDGNIADIDSIECAQVERGIDVTGEYNTIDGIEMRYWLTRCIGTTNFNEITVYGLNVRNCYLAYTASKEDGVGYGVQLFYCDMIVENNIAHDNGRRNLSFNLVNQSVGNPTTMRDVIIQDNLLFNGWHTTGVDLAIQGRFKTVRNIVIRRNKIWEDHAFSAYKAEMEYAITMCFIENNGDSADIDTVYFYNNIIQNSFRTGLQLNGIANAFVFHNTFSGKSDTATNDGHGLIYIGDTYDGEDVNLFAMNNIFFNYGIRDTNLTANIWGSTGGITNIDSLDYNLHYVEANSPGNYLFHKSPEITSYRHTDSVAMRAAGYGIHSYLNPIRPEFVDTLTDFHLQANSPAIEAATPITTAFTPLNIITDIEGNTRDATNPDMGAYEFQVVVESAPVNIKNSTIPISGGKARINSEGKIILYNTN